MKKVINQNVELPTLSNQLFAVVVTRGKKTYQFNYETRENAMQSFVEHMADESNFCALIGKKSTIGLYRKTIVNTMLILRQITMAGVDC